MHKIDEDRTYSSGDMIADIEKNTRTDRQTDTLITILRVSMRGVGVGVHECMYALLPRVCCVNRIATGLKWFRCSRL